MDLGHFRELYELIAESEAHGPLARVEGPPGLSGDAVVGTLQRLARYQASFQAGCYLEVGVFQGLTLTSTALALSSLPAFGIDNFAQFDGSGENRSIVENRIRRNGLKNVAVIDCDYEDALENLRDHVRPPQVHTYFVDGPHDYRSQLMCLLLAREYLSELAVIIVDDSNYRHVRLANRDFLRTNTEFKLLFEAYTSEHPLQASDRAAAEKGWWNGVNVLVRDPAGVLAPFYPPTLRSRALYENEHMVHSARLGALAPEAVTIVSSLHPLRPIRVLRRLRAVRRKAMAMDPVMRGEREAMNTFSRDLVARRVNPAL